MVIKATRSIVVNLITWDIAQELRTKFYLPASSYFVFLGIWRSLGTSHFFHPIVGLDRTILWLAFCFFNI